MNILPIMYAKLDRSGYQIYYYDVAFLEGFGPFKKDDRVNLLCFDAERGTLAEIDTFGKSDRQTQVSLVSGIKYAF